MGKRRSISFPKGEKNGRVSGRGKRQKIKCVCMFWVGEGGGSMSECGRRRVNERILYIFLYLSFPCYLPYDFLIHQNAGKIMFWAK